MVGFFKDSISLQLKTTISLTSLKLHEKLKTFFVNFPVNVPCSGSNFKDLNDSNVDFLFMMQFTYYILTGIKTLS